MRENMTTTGILCKCNNCETIMYDENPNTEETQSTDKEVVHMLYNSSDRDNIFWACPVCQTDDYLNDFID